MVGHAPQFVPAHHGGDVVAFPAEDVSGVVDVIEGVFEVGVIQEVVLLEAPRLLDLEAVAAGRLQEVELVLDARSGEDRYERDAEAEDEPQEEADAQPGANGDAGAFEEAPLRLFRNRVERGTRLLAGGEHLRPPCPFDARPRAADCDRMLFAMSRRAT